MAWIESHAELERHPKTGDLMAAMGWDLDTTLGKLHRFWWWCQQYAEDGDLRRHNDARLGAAVGLNGDTAKRFVEAMVEARWLDRTPYFRVHDWWDFIGPWLRAKYKRTPACWQAVKDMYGDQSEEDEEKQEKKDVPVTATVTQPLRNRIPTGPDRTYQPNPTAVQRPLDSHGESERPGTATAWEKAKPREPAADPESAAARIAEEGKLLGLTWKVTGAYQGLPIRDLPLEYCGWARKTLGRLGTEYQLALDLRLRQAQEDRAR